MLILVRNKEVIRLVKAKVSDLKGKEDSKLDLPEVFGQNVRPDLIKKSVLSAQSSKVQPKGTDPRAGMKNTAETPPKGSGQTRVRRIQGRRYHAAGRAAWAPFTVGGRKAHPPKSEKDRSESINVKEKNLALRSAISATSELDLVISRGHEVNGLEELPIIVDDDFEKIKKTKNVKKVLENLGVWKDVERVKKGKKIRSGKGKARGRKYKTKVGPLLVVSEDRGIGRGANNLPGVDTVEVGLLDAEDLAPGGDPIRLTVWSQSAIDSIRRRFSN